MKNSGGLRLVDDHGSGRAVDNVDADQVVAALKEAIHLLVLGALTFLAVGDIQIDLDIQRLLLFERRALQLLGHGLNEGVLLLIQRDPDPQRSGRLRVRAAGRQQRQQQRQRGDQAAELFHRILSSHVTGNSSF